MAEPKNRENEQGGGEEGEKVEGVGSPPVVVHHGIATVPKINVHRLVEMHEKDKVDFPVDADESRRRGGTGVEIQEQADE